MENYQDPKWDAWSQKVVSLSDNVSKTIKKSTILTNLRYFTYLNEQQVRVTAAATRNFPVAQNASALIKKNRHRPKPARYMSILYFSSFILKRLGLYAF